MKLQQLEVFVAVAEELHFRRAADRLLIHPSAASKMIAELEIEHGVQLFDRSSRNVLLTDDGAVLLGEARSILDGVASMKRTATALARGEQKRLVVGSLDEGLADYTLLIHELFRARFPKVEIEEIVVDYDEVETALRPRSPFDLVAGAQDGLHDRRGLAWQPVFSEPHCVGLANDHPLASRSSVAKAELLDQPFVYVPGLPGVMHDRFMLRSERDLTRSPDVVVDAVHMQNILNCIARGEAVCTFTHANERYFSRPDITYVPVVDIEPTTIGLYTRQGDDRPHVVGYLSAARDVVRMHPRLVATVTPATT